MGWTFAMPATSQKNQPLSVLSLGLGDQLQQQVEDEEEERRKKLSQNSATQVGGIYSPAVNALFGTTGGGNG